jgi:membrane peptidoglycan carboxypeptidase
LTGRASKFRLASVIIYPESVRVIMKISRQRRRKIITAIAMILLLSAASVVAVQSTGPRRPRRWAVRPLNRERITFGHYHSLVQFIKQNDKEQFFKYTRLSPALFNALLAIVEQHLAKHPAGILFFQFIFVVGISFVIE